MGDFKKWLLTELDVRSFKSHKTAKKPEKENFLDGMWRELGIDPNTLPEYIESGPVELSEEGLWFNQAIWQLIKPIDLKDSFVRLKFHKSLSPNLNQHCYIRQENGKMMPYHGDISGRTFLIPIKKFAEMLGQGWQSVMNQQQPML